MCLIGYQHLEQCYRTGTKMPMSLGHSPRIKLQPLWCGSLFTLTCAFADWKYSWILLLFIDHPTAMPSTIFSSASGPESLFQKVYLEVPCNLVVYDSMIPDGIWLIPHPLSSSSET